MRIVDGTRERLRSLFRRRAPRSGEAAKRETSGPAQDGGRVYALWALVLPVLLGATLGWFAAVCLGVLLDRSGGLGSLASGPSGAGVEQDVMKKPGMESFLAANPFRVSPMAAPEVKSGVSEDVVVTGSLATAVLRGTLPGVGAWLEDKGQTRLVLVDASFDVYTLDSVTYREAVFVKDEERVVRELIYGTETARARPRQAPAAQANANVPVGNVVAAIPGEQDGEVPSGMIDSLVQNPFDELKKVRLRPTKDGEPGLQIQWIQNDSILKQLGVQKGDVIRSINGIPFSNMGDIANSINSLMNSERFDVEVFRGGQSTALRYVVR